MRTVPIEDTQSLYGKYSCYLIKEECSVKQKKYQELFYLWMNKEQIEEVI